MYRAVLERGLRKQTHGDDGGEKKRNVKDGGEDEEFTQSAKSVQAPHVSGVNYAFKNIVFNDQLPKSEEKLKWRKALLLFY